ncbi:p53-like transcription factor DNA-binding [Penicillium waksmanii]|uniref:p53-like transcription factor DNA-binding n=1 Tax=Penicillium waksmanii TaxID=69791 RepID=UPI002548697E|nr:p53-like transcription factor DNA-binding [Penicillium waksmanii]KAJ5974299.1 p53-like transcription factor DNA-binding [Penicillium waksmanii]
MNPSALLPDAFSMECPVTTDGDYINPHVTGFPTNDDDNQRVGGLASMPVTNGVRYHAQQPAMQELHYPGSSALAMTPPDSCSDFRRVPALQPPAGMSINMQSPNHTVDSIPGLMGRANAYSSSYALHRGIGLPLSVINSRSHQYPSTPRALDGLLDRNQAAVFQHPMVESTQRSSTLVEAPPFEDTTILESIVAEFGGTQQTLKPEVQAKIGRGFFASDGKWTCYRRNYFAVNCSFSLHPWPSTVPLFIRHSDQTLEPIRGFRMRISAIVNGSYNETRPLVQHTPKRDKQSERTPGPVILQPTPPPSLTAGSTGAGGHATFPLNSQSLDYNSAFAGAPQPCQPPTSHLFERIQFQKATANNGKRRAQQQYYNLVVELYAEVPRGDISDWVQVARRHSHPMVVRGRSPGHYKDGRRDSTASMGPDGESGEGPGSGLPHGMGPTSRSHMLMHDNSYRSSLPYGRTDYRQMNKPEHSPLLDSPLVSSSSSSGFDYSIMNDTMDPMDTLKTDSTLDPYQDPVFPDLPHHHRPGTGGYDPVYSTYGRYDPIQNPHSLCT